MLQERCQPWEWACHIRLSDIVLSPCECERADQRTLCTYGGHVVPVRGPHAMQCVGAPQATLVAIFPQEALCEFRQEGACSDQVEARRHSWFVQAFATLLRRRIARVTRASSSSARLGSARSITSTTAASSSLRRPRSAPSLRLLAHDGHVLSVVLDKRSGERTNIDSTNAQQSRAPTKHVAGCKIVVRSKC